MSLTLELAATLLSVVSFVVTVLGFFAALKFYRDGVELQRAANDALTKVAEKTDSIQAQVGGMFDKTLDAAIGKRNQLAEGFEDIERQLSDAKNALLAEIRNQVGEAGEQQQRRIKQTVEEQIQMLRQKVEVTRESAEEIANRSIWDRRDAPLKHLILRALASLKPPVDRQQLERFLVTSYPLVRVDAMTRRIRELMSEGYIVKSEDAGLVKYDLTTAGANFLEKS